MPDNKIKFSKQLQCETTTTIRAEMEQGEFPSDMGPCYLLERAAYAIHFPRISISKKRGTQYLKQLALSQILRTEEKLNDYYWAYKAEVVFAMKADQSPPVPILSRGHQKDRPRSFSIFARPSVANVIKFGVTGIRRPDIILVKNPLIRWPGRKTQYFDGWEYDDNLKMLIEVKFPGDTLSRRQEEDYLLIATQERFGVLRIDKSDLDQRKTEAAGEREALLGKFGHFFPTLLLPPTIRPNPPQQPEPIRANEEALFDKILNSPYFPLLDIHNTPLIKETPWEGKLPEWQLWTIMTEKAVESLANNEWQKVAIREASEITKVLTMPFVYQQKVGQTLSELGLLHERYTVESEPTSSWYFLSDELLADFKAMGAFFIDAGQWVCDALIDPKTQTALKVAFYYIVAETNEIISLTDKTIESHADTVLNNTDFTAEDIKDFEFIHVVMQISYGPSGQLMLAIKRNISDEIQYVVVGVVVAIALIILAICFAGAEIIGLSIAALASLGSSLATLVLE
ncbi:TPA: VRR-NUC domain-containing protein [Providencia rettgeri]|uniref:VRR-NUC domain-containing protein n=1 Tax=Providencia huaxiensis TaxID=2027290 RepID=UPI0024AA61DA|nr:VRR-NUC domain-containing protein [Providencia stuartii]HEC8323168.1 VRR-NUC domain-containing protein [Providencia rettgeri]